MIYLLVGLLIAIQPDTVEVGNMGARLLDHPSTRNVVTTIPAGTKIHLKGEFHNGLHKVNYDTLSGWVADVWLKEPVTPRVINQPSERYVRLSELYGPQYAAKLIRGEVWIGITKTMAEEALGRPNRKRSTESSAGKVETWEYKDKWLIFWGNELNTIARF